MSNTSVAGGIVIVGSLNADLVVRVERFPRPGETLRGSALQTLPGGKSANQAVAAARLGGDVRLVGAVGDDENGRMLLASARTAGVDTGRVRVDPSVATGTAVITVDAHAENTIIVSPGANGTLTADDLTTDAFDQAAVLGLCLEVSLDVVLAAARIAHERGVTILTNLSPLDRVPDELVRLTDVLLVNEHEAAQLLGATLDDPAAVGRGIAARGVARAVITTGADGCVVFDGGTPPVAVPSPVVTAVDTTGCGDAFMGALAVRLAAGDDLADAARFAVRVGSLAATKEGAQGSYPTRDEVHALAS
ncbi:MAG: ribokinase [Frondihabitans sp.]|nr:ribokinase [Frondihabitans sp.]